MRESNSAVRLTLVRTLANSIAADSLIPTKAQAPCTDDRVVLELELAIRAKMIND